MKRINHKSLAIVSGVALIIIIGVNIASAPQGDTQNSNNSPQTIQQEVTQEPQTTTPNPTAIIDLSGEGLTEVPGVIFTRKNIETLDVSNNNLSGALQAEIRHMSSLKTLDLSDNMFTGVPAEVGQLENLETLDLSNNKITGLPYEIGNLKRLKTFDLRGNEYSEQDLEIIRSNLPETTNIITE